MRGAAAGRVLRGVLRGGVAHRAREAALLRVFQQPGRHLGVQVREQRRLLLGRVLPV